MNITELKLSWQEWKASRDLAIWPEIIEGFDELLVEAGTPDHQRLSQLEAENNTMSQVMANAFKALSYAGPDYTALPRAIEETMGKLKADLSEANHWRERHSKDAEAYGKQSQANWERAEKAEKCCAEMREWIAQLKLQHEDYCPECSSQEHADECRVPRLLSSSCGQGYVSKEELKPTIVVLECALDYALGRTRVSFSGKQWGAEQLQAELDRLQNLMEGKA